MKKWTFGMMLALLLPLVACGGKTGKAEGAAETEGAPVADKNVVVETLLTRRSVRKYQPQPVGREQMQVIVDCGIHAPNAMNKQPWEIRVVDNPEFIDGVTALFRREKPEMAADPNFKNMFRNAPTVVFVGHDVASPTSAFDCGLLSENMMVAAWSMGIGSCCLGSPAAFMRSPVAAEYLKRLEFSEGYELLYCIAFGYPDETPAAKPRDAAKVKFVE